MFKRICCFVLAFSIIFSVCGCSKEKSKTAQSSETSTVSKTPSRVTSEKTSEDTVSEVDDRLVFGTKLATSDFEKEDFVFYFSHEYSYSIDREVALFNDRNNARVKIHIIAGDFEEIVSKSIASGAPYDLVENNSNNFPKTAFRDFYEPQQTYIEEYDYFNVAKPQNGGFIKTINDIFTWNGNLYACGNAKSMKFNLMYYNKVMFREKGLEEPYELWRAGEWTWEKFVSMGKEVNNSSENISFLAAPDLSYWWNICGVTPISRKGDTLSANLGNKSLISATKNYRNLFVGNNAVCNEKNGIDAFKEGKSYMVFSDSPMYYSYMEVAKRSDLFGRNSNNIGYAPIPSGLTAGGVYTGREVTGYSTIKGAKVPYLAAAFALSNSRTDSNVSGMHLDASFRMHMKTSFAANGFLNITGIENSEGLTYEQLIDLLSQKIINGDDITATLKSVHTDLTKMISDSM